MKRYLLSPLYGVSVTLTFCVCKMMHNWVKSFIHEHLIATTVLKLNYCKKVFFFLIHLFARDVLVMKKLDIEKTKPIFMLGGLSFLDFQFFY